MQTITVTYPNKNVGYASFNSKTGQSAFEYDPSFIKIDIQLSPFTILKTPHLYIKITNGA